MYTRGMVARNYDVRNPERVVTPGYIRQTTTVPDLKGGRNNNVVQTWAITRPGAQWEANGSPTYHADYLRGELIRGGVPALTPSRPNLEMDPRDPNTWQRQYRFT